MTLKPDLQKIFAFSSLLTALVVLAFFVNQATGNTLIQGIIPRSVEGLVGIITVGFVHADCIHLASNCTALFFLTTLLSITYPKKYFSIFWLLYFVTNICVWLAARNAIHVGISGTLYAEAAFIFFAGLLSKEKGAAGISLIIVFMYGGAVWGIFQKQPHISWESHALGALTGCISAFVYRFKYAKNLQPAIVQPNLYSTDFVYVSSTDTRYQTTYNYSESNSNTD